MTAKKSKIPFGYRIENGKAVVCEKDAEKLKRYFRLFLAGESMSAAACEAGLTCSAGTYPNLLRRKEYLGDDYYPALIDASYQQELIDEWERRKRNSPRKPRTPSKREVKVYTSFEMLPMPELRHEDPLRFAELSYRCLVPTA